MMVHKFRCAEAIKLGEEAKLRYEAAHFNQATQLYRAAVEKESTPSPLDYDLARSLIMENKHAEAIPHMERYINCEEAHGYNHQEYLAGVYITLGDAYHHVGKLSKALQAYDDAMRIYPLSYVANIKKSKSLLKMAKMEEAEIAYEVGRYIASEFCSTELPEFEQCKTEEGTCYLAGDNATEGLCCMNN